MWWLVGLLTALVAASSNSARNQVASASGVTEAPARALTYRSRDGSSFFRFRITRNGDDIRIHILESPKPQVGSCHVLHDPHGPYVCWSQAVRSIAEAKAVAG